MKDKISIRVNISAEYQVTDPVKATLMEGSPILVRLKELETLEKLEKLVEKVDRLTVANGFEGLLANLVSLKTE
jgi:hypothetical protein